MTTKALYVPFLFLLVIIGIAEWFIAPIGDFALNDDWAYARSVHVLNTTGKFEIGIWPGMSLFSHVLLGTAFVKIFGFSYTVLRFANMAFSLVTLFFVYRLFLRSQKPVMAMFLCAVIFFNPFYINLFNSFMTDLSFFNFSFLAYYALTGYYQERKKIYLGVFFIMAVLAMLTRQLGIVLFAAYFIASIVDFLQSQNKKEIFSSVVMCASGVLILYGFEKYMSYRLTPDSSYQGIFVSPKEIPLGADAVSRIFEKTAMILRNSGSAFVILFVLFLPGLVSRIKAIHYIRWMLLFSVCAIVFFSMPHVEVIGDVLINFGLGLESTVDIAYLAENTQTNMHPFYDLLQGLLVAGALLFLLFISSFSNSKITTIKPTTVFLFALCFFYLVSIGVAESSYDRYCLFFMLFAFITVAENMIKWTSYSRVMSAVLLLGMSVFSVLATRDYFDTAKLKMNIRKELLSDVNIAEKDINTGFEHELWNGTVHEFNWINWDHYMDKRFVLARGSMDGFMVQKTYMYSKYLPPFSSTFYVLERADTLQSH